MPNGKELINELNYQEIIEGMPAKKRAVFTAMQVYETNLTVADHEKRIRKMETPSIKKRLTFGGSAIAFVSGIFYALGVKLGWWV